MFSAGMPFSMMIMMIALDIRIIRKRILQQIFHGPVSRSGNSAI